MIWNAFILVSLLATLALVIRKTKSANSISYGLDEPPTVTWLLPLVGPIIGLFRHGGAFYELLRDRVKLPIYTLFILNQKFYFVSSPELISQINRKQKTIQANGPVIDRQFARLLGLDREGLMLLRDNPLHRGTPAPLRREVQETQHEMLKPGIAMRKLWSDLMAEFTTRLNATIVPAPSQSEQYNLKGLVRNLFTPAAAHALYGRGNIFELYPSLIDDYWILDEEMLKLIVNPFPSVTARRGLQARQRVTDAFERHHQLRNMLEQEETSEFVKRMISLTQRHGLSSANVAKMMLGIILGISISSVPSTIWMLSFILNDSRLHERVTEEALNAVEIQKEEDGAGHHHHHHQSLDIDKARRSCPLLWSTVQEVLRVVTAAVQTLEVLEDTEIDERFLLKRGALIQIPTLSIHTDPAVWGHDATRFVPDRFIINHSSSPSAKRHHPSSFRAFGGGVAMCPGRHLGMDLMMALAIVLLTSFEFDLSPSDHKMPEIDRSPLGAVLKPRSEFPLILTRRAGQEHMKWSFK